MSAPQDFYENRAEAYRDPNANPHMKFYGGLLSPLANLPGRLGFTPGDYDPVAHEAFRAKAAVTSGVVSRVNEAVRLGQDPRDALPMILGQLPEAERQIAVEGLRDTMMGSPPIARHVPPDFLSRFPNAPQAQAPAQAAPAPGTGMAPTGKTPATRAIRENPQGVNKNPLGLGPGDTAARSPLAPAVQTYLQGVQQTQRGQEITREATTPEAVAKLDPTRVTANALGLSVPAQNPIGGSTDTALRERELADRTLANQRARELALLQRPSKPIVGPGGNVYAGPPEAPETGKPVGYAEETSAEARQSPFQTTGFQTEAAKKLQAVQQAQASVNELDTLIRTGPRETGTLAAITKFATDLYSQTGRKPPAGAQAVSNERQALELLALSVRRQVGSVLEVEGRGGEWTDEQLNNALGVTDAFYNVENWPHTHAWLVETLGNIEDTVRRNAMIEAGLEPDPFEGLSPEDEAEARLIQFQWRMKTIDDAEARSRLEALGLD